MKVRTKYRLKRRSKLRRKLQRSDFRKKTSVFSRISCGEHGFIDIDKISRVFPDLERRNEYLINLYNGLGE